MLLVQSRAPATVSSIEAVPSGSIISVFGFSGSYQSVTTLEPGMGYWFNVSQNCQLSILDYSKKSSSQKGKTLQPEFIFPLIIGNAESNTDTLYFGAGVILMLLMVLTPNSENWNYLLCLRLLYLMHASWFRILTGFR